LSTSLPIKWLPADLPGQVEAALRRTLDDWTRDWGAPGATNVSARTLAAREAPAVVGSIPWDELPTEWRVTLARALLGPSAPASPVAQGAVQQATVELQEGLRQRFRTSPLRRFEPARVGNGGVEACFELLGFRFAFVLDVEELQSGGWLPAAPRRHLARIELADALRDVSVPLTAQLGHATVSVTDILQLRPGDILLLNESLDAPLQVTSPGSPLQLSAHLGATPSQPAHRAMRWLAS